MQKHTHTFKQLLIKILFKNVIYNYIPDISSSEFFLNENLSLLINEKNRI